MYPELKENRPHGTDNYPYTQYHMHNIFHAFQIPVHWHDELEVIYTKKGPLNLLIDGKEYTAEDGSVYFVAPGQLHLMGSAAGDVDYYTLLFPLEFISFQSDDSLERELFFPLRNHTLSFPVNFQRITTQQQRHPFCLIRSSTPTLTVLLRTKKTDTKTSLAPAFFS